MKQIANEKRFTATEALSSVMGAKDYVELIVSDAWRELWNSPLRPDIKPDRQYEICVQMREVPHPKKETGNAE